VLTVISSGTKWSREISAKQLIPKFQMPEISPLLPIGFGRNDGNEWPVNDEKIIKISAISSFSA
jgi:hypothetical protein